VTAARPVPFRAGRTDAGASGADSLVTAHATEHALGTKTLLADISEFQPDISDAAYLAWSKAIVIRAAYGAHHDDRAWYGGQRRDLLLSGGALFLGIYQYITASEDVTAQAMEFCRLLGKLNQGEYPLADWEEGDGNQAGRRATWNHVVAGELGFTPGSGYSGLFFARDHGLAPVEWVAAYQGTEPSPPHLLWQFTSAFQVPGAGLADCSVYHGPVTDLASHAFGGTPAATWTETLLSDLPLIGTGGIISGDDVKSAQGLLLARGYPVTVDGSYGPVTRSAVTAFQHGSGLAADGLVGPQTWRKLLNR
jgi:Putative peptidoglycan binding domain